MRISNVARIGSWDTTSGSIAFVKRYSSDTPGGVVVDVERPSTSRVHTTTTIPTESSRFPGSVITTGQDLRIVARALLGCRDTIVGVARLSRDLATDVLAILSEAALLLVHQARPLSETQTQGQQTAETRRLPKDDNLSHNYSWHRIVNSTEHRRLRLVHGGARRNMCRMGILKEGSRHSG